MKLRIRGMDARRPKSLQVVDFLLGVSSTFFCLRKNEGLSTALLGRMLKSGGCFDRFEAVKRPRFHGDPDGQSAACLSVGPWEPSAGWFVCPWNFRSANGACGSGVVFVND